MVLAFLFEFAAGWGLFDAIVADRILAANQPIHDEYA
jgi:hypothetical protein